MAEYAEYIDRNLIEWYGCNFEDASCKDKECSGCYHAECSHSQVMQIPTVDVIVITDGATNGDMTLKLFDTATIYGIDKENDCITICIDNNYYQKFSYSWWNSKYEKGAEE